MSIKQVLLLEETPEEVVDRAGMRQFEYDSRERAYHWMRTIVGLLGVSLPPLLFFGWMKLDETDAEIQGSLSAYYHTGMRDFFVGILSVIGFLLFTYKIAEKTPENRWSQAGGIAAVGVALVPTGIPATLVGRAANTPIQDLINSWTLPFKLPFNKTTSELLHYGFAISLIVILFVLCLNYMSQERRKGAWRWYRFHRAMATAMVLAGIYVVVAPWLNLFEEHRILLGEWVVIWAFGFSWLLKGWHVEVLFGKTSPDPRVSDDRAPAGTTQVHTADA